MVAALSSWAHVYKVLTVDVDKKVREATQVSKPCKNSYALIGSEITIFPYIYLLKEQRTVKIYILTI